MTTNRDELLATARKLHAAICQAVTLMQRTPSREPEFHEAHTILRQSLAEYTEPTLPQRPEGAAVAYSAVAESFDALRRRVAELSEENDRLLRHIGKVSASAVAEPAYRGGYGHKWVKLPAQAATVSDARGFRWGSMATELHPRTRDLVARFAVALAEKLAAAEKKYGYSDGWADDDWLDECRAKLRDHVEKGDPRDVAAYCAFLWHHGESTALASSPAAPAPVDDEDIAYPNDLADPSCGECGGGGYRMVPSEEGGGVYEPCPCIEHAAPAPVIPESAEMITTWFCQSEHARGMHGPRCRQLTRAEAAAISSEKDHG